MAVQIFPRRSVTLPSGGAALREPYSRGLVSALAPGAGLGLTDLVSGIALAPSGAALGTGGGTAGLVCSATGASAAITAPTALRLAVPLTLVARVGFLGTPTASAGIFGVHHNNTDTTPFSSYVLGIDGTGLFNISWSNGATFVNFTGGAGYQRAPVVGRPLTLAGVFTSTGCTIYLGVDEGAFTASAANPTYGATAELFIGTPGPPVRNSNLCLEYGLIYNRRLAPAELKLFRDDPYHWLRPAGTQLFVGAAVAGVLVPDVVGDTLAVATSALGAVGLTVGSVTTSPAVPVGVVLSQSPLAGTDVPLGSAVDLLLSIEDASVYTARITQAGVEALAQGIPAARLTQAIVELLGRTTVDPTVARLSQAALELLSGTAVDARLTQYVLEALSEALAVPPPPTDPRISQALWELLTARPAPPAPPGIPGTVHLMVLAATIGGAIQAGQVRLTHTAGTATVYASARDRAV